MCPSENTEEGIASVLMSFESNPLQYGKEHNINLLTKPLKIIMKINVLNLEIIITGKSIVQLLDYFQLVIECFKFLLSSKW